MSISCSALTCINGQDAFWLAFLIAFFFGKYNFNHLRNKIYVDTCDQGVKIVNV